MPPRERRNLGPSTAESAKLRDSMRLDAVYGGRMPDQAPLDDWAVGGLAQLLDTVVSSAGRSGDLTPIDRELFAETGAAAFGAGISLSQLIGTYLGGAGEIWETLFTDADQSKTVELSRSLRRVSEQAVSCLAEGFEAAQRLSIRAEEALRFTFLDDLLSPGSDPLQLANTAEQLGFPGFERVVAAVGDAGRIVTDAGPVSRRIRIELQSRAPQRDIRVTARDGKLVLIAIDMNPDELRDLASRVFGAASELDWRVGVGSGVQTLESVVVSYHEALDALRIGGAFGLDSPTEFEQILPHRLLAADLGVTQALVRSVLDPISAKPSSQLMTTLASLIEHGGNMAEVARDLNIGARTVAYRLDRIGELTGYSPRVPFERFVLELAYWAAPMSRPLRRKPED